MLKADVITLVKETEQTRGVHESAIRTEREVMCTVQSVTRSEFYAAQNVGVDPELVFVLTLSEDYEGERLIVFHGIEYRVVRTYVTEADSIEITVQRRGED